ncbi:MAG: TonB-dependent receptor [Steroidobacteraceae bacterium]|nr:TonB-dependent receptor [Steroidobacteraceae bacterium]
MAFFVGAAAHSGQTDEARELPAVVVTGSRIPTANDASTAPVTVLTQQELVQGGNDSLGRVLQALPYATGGALNTNVNNGGDGATRIDLRGLGPQRTVVLLNGRSLPNGGIGADSSVDVDSLPLSLVERVEVLATGASAIYGADAIGGVINVITRRDFEGLELGAQGARSSARDGAIARAHALGGLTSESTSWMFGAEWVDQAAVTMDARGFSAIPQTVASADGTRVPFGSLSTVPGRFRVGPGNAFGLAPGGYTRVQGATGQTAADWRSITAADTFNYAPYAYLQTPNERSSLWVLGRQQLTGGVEAFFEGTFRRRESSQALAPAPFMIASNSAPRLPNGQPYVPANNFYNPFRVNLLAGTRRLVELGSRDYAQRVDAWRALAGLEGEWGRWQWQLSVGLAESDAISRENGAPVNERFVTAVGPSGRDSSGRIVCGTPDPTTGIVPAGSVIVGCVPIDLFGVPGSISAEQAEYVSSGVLVDVGVNSQRQASFGLTGTWGDLPAGHIEWAVGADFQHVSGAYRYDPRRVNGLVGAGTGTDVPGGSFDSREAYTEARLPLLRDGDRVGPLDATLGVRFSDFSTFGSETTWRAGLRWVVSPAWTARVDYATLFRAPNLIELFETQDEFVGPAPLDPCGRSPTLEQQVNCAGAGVPAGYVQQDSDIALTRVGGNPGLGPEDGHSLDVGIDFHSRDSRWETRMDYFQTTLDGFVERPAADLLLDECATHGTPLACARVGRRADGSLNSIDTRHLNVGRVTVRGVDLGASSHLTSRTGNFVARALVTRLLDHESELFDDSETQQRVGFGNAGLVLPKWRAHGSLAWKHANWGARYTAQWIGAFQNCVETLDSNVYCGRVPSIVYHDLEMSRSWSSLELRAGGTNLTNESPPYMPGEANTNAATYRLLGRLYFVRLEFAVN